MKFYLEAGRLIQRFGFVVYFVGSALNAQSIPLQVIDDKSGQGVKCDIYKFEADSKTCCIVASTDVNGKGVLNDIGRQGETLRPVHLDYEATKDVPCPVTTLGPLVIEVHKVKNLS